MEKRRFGSHYGGHTIIDNLQDDSLVYSCGIGDNASFDLAIIEEYGCNVYAFDPTPESIEWIKSKEWPEQFLFYEFGVAATEGIRKFYLPPIAGHISHSTIARSPNSIEVVMTTIDKFARRMGHDSIDLLKLDVEGTEYEIIDNFPKTPIKQIAVEFHHFFSGLSMDDTVRAIDTLNDMGYRVFHGSSDRRNWGFIKC